MVAGTEQSRRQVAAVATRPSGRLMRRLAKAHVLNHLVMLLGALLMLAPFIWMLSTSFKPRAETISFPPALLPKHWTLQNYVDVFDRLNIGRLYVNTLVVSLTKTVIMVYTSTLLGYVFGKFQFRGRDTLFLLLLSTMILPFEVYMIPLYVMMVDANLGNTWLALIVPYIFSAWAMFLFRQFMYSIPNDLIDAARIDGASESYIFHRIILPLARAALATLISFYFMWNWNDFLWPLIVIADSDKQMLPVGLATFANEVSSDYGVVMAGASLAIIPVLIVFTFMQRQIIQGIALTGLK
jgi:ABC-type glycerol-3-phosphate transport system permease component